MRSNVAGAIDYPRLLLLLGTVTVLLGLTDRWRPVLSPLPSLAVYGVLHSIMVNAALNTAHSLGRKAAFVIAASVLATTSFVLARFISHFFATTPGMSQPMVLLTLSSGLGAASYCLLIRRCWTRDLPQRALVWITLCCMTSTLVALPLGLYLHTAGAGWFATIWWWAFSLALWYRDGRGYRREAPHVWHS